MAISGKLISAINFCGHLHPAKIVILRRQDDIGCFGYTVAIGIAGPVPVNRVVGMVNEQDRYGFTRPGDYGYPNRLDIGDLADWDLPGHCRSSGIKLFYCNPLK